MKTNWFKRTLCGILAFIMVLGYIPAAAFAAAEDGLCEHHLQHTEECGYSAAVEGHACNHAHTDECYDTVTKCVHTHGDCGYVPAVEGHGCDCQPNESGEIIHTEGCGYVEAVAEVPCGHVCSEESGCVAKTLNCQHQHDAACGYAEAAAETPCGFVCEECAKEASDVPAPTEYHGSTATEADTTWGLRGASTFSLEGNSSDSLSSGFYRITTKLDRDYKLTLSSSSYSCVTTGESDAQVFYVSQLENGYFVIYDSSKTSVVTALSSEFAENTQMELQEYSDISQQHWAILPAEEDDESYYIVTAENDMYLDVNNADCYKNAIVKLFPRNVLYDAQNWYFEPYENYQNSDNCSCLEQYAGNYVVCNTSELAIRDGHSITSKQLGKIPLGAEIVITKASGAAGSSDAWGHVTYNGISGYIHMAYVERQIESLGSGNCGAEGSNVTWNLASDGTLTISGIGKMADYEYNAFAPWYDLRNQIIKVAIQPGVTTIGSYAFWSCSKLTTVEIPDGVTHIGNCAFMYCTMITSVSIPNGTTLGGNVFCECTGLISVNLPDRMTTLGVQTFLACRNLSSITIPDGITTIREDTFGGCSSLTSINIPDSVTSIEHCAFSGCAGLSSIDIPDSVVSISSQAFQYCTSLTSVYIPDSVAHFGSGVFDNCTNLVSVRLPKNVTSGGSFSFTECKKLRSIIIPNGITSLDWSAFSECRALVSVAIPSSVTYIDRYAFFSSGIQYVFYAGTESQWNSTKIEYTGNGLLRDATKYYNISDPAEAVVDSGFCGADGENLTYSLAGDGTLTITGSGAMKNYTSTTKVPWYSKRNLIASVILTDGITSVGDYAFNSCLRLTSASIPNSVTSIGNSAFAGCSGLKDVNFDGTETQWNQIVIGDNNSELTNANIHFNGNGSSSELTLVSTSPAAGATNVSLDSPFVLTFSEDIDPNLHWENGKIYFLDYNTSRTILEINSKNSDLFGCTVNGNELILSNVFRYEWFRLSESGKISVIIPQGVIAPLASNNSSSDFIGIINADDYSFTLERHLISSNFTMGKDSFNFNNSEVAFGPRQYEFREEDISKLFSKCSATEKFILNASIKIDQMSQFSGNCFGMAALMALFANGQLDLSQMQSDAQCVFDVSQPKNNLTVRSYISCYNALQTLVIPQIESKLGIQSQEELAVSLVSALIHNKKAVPLMVELESGAVSGGWHAVVAYAIDIVSDPDNYIVYIADSNAFRHSVMFDGSPVFDGNSKLVQTYCPVLLYIRKDTYEINSTHALCPHFEEVGTSGICGNYKSLIWVVDNLSIFNKYSIQGNSGVEGGVCSPTQSVLKTDAKSFRIEADGKEAVISNGAISGNLAVSGPFFDANGLTNTQMQTYYIPFSTVYSITTDTSNSQTMLLRFGQSETASCVQGSINKVVFSVDRSLSISGASGETKLYLSTDDDNAEETFAVCAKSSVPEATFYSVGKTYILKTSEAIGEATLTNYTGFESLHSTTVSTDGNEILAYLQDQDNIEEIVVDNNTSSTIRINMPSGIVDSDEVWIDGMACPVQSDGNILYVTFPSTCAYTMVTYSYNNPNATDVHTKYPTGMKVWKLKQENGVYTATYIPELDNLLQYSGSSIRITGNKGIRMITSVNQDTRNALTGNGLAGYKLLEYGTLLAQTSKLKDNPLVLGGGDYVKSNYAYKKGVADPVFKYANGLIQYTNVLIGFTDEQCKEDIAMRPYMKLLDENGEEFIIYGGIVYRSIGYIAYQNRNAFQPGSAAYEYVWSIIHNVYGTKYDSEYRK